VIVWSDCGGSFSASRDEARQAVKYEGRYTARDGRNFTVECNTPEGKTGQATIDGQSFLLQTGRIFLVSTAGSATEVRQLARDDLKPDSAELKIKASRDMEIKEFFETAVEQGKKIPNGRPPCVVERPVYHRASGGAAAPKRLSAAPWNWPLTT
jgi:hypothetical protein